MTSLTAWAEAAGVRMERALGRVRLLGQAIDVSPWCEVERFEAEVPGGIGWSGATDPRVATTWRARCEALSVVIDGARLQRSVENAAASVPWIASARVDLGEDRVRLHVAVAGADGRGEVTAHCGVFAVAGRVYVVPFSYLVVGRVARAAPALMRDALRALLAPASWPRVLDDDAVHLIGDALVLDVGRLAVGEHFGRLGWKLPGTERCVVDELRIAPGRALVAMRPGVPAAAASHVATTAFAAWSARSDAPALSLALASGEAVQVVEAIERDGAPTQYALDLHLDALAVADPARAASIAAARLAASPADLAAMLTLLRLKASSGDLQAIVALSRPAIDMLGRQGHSEDQVRLVLWVARELEASAPDVATKWIEAALKLAPHDIDALNVRVELAARLGDAARYEDGLTRLLPLARGREEQVSLRRALAQLAVAHHHDPDQARHHLSEAVAIAPGDPSLWLWLGDLAEARGVATDAVHAYRKAARCVPADEAPHNPAASIACIDGALAAARVWSSAFGDSASAARELRLALDRFPHADALRDALAALAAGAPIEPSRVDHRGASTAAADAFRATGAAAAEAGGHAEPPNDRVAETALPARQVAASPDAHDSAAAAALLARRSAAAEALAIVARLRPDGPSEALADALDACLAFVDPPQERAALAAELGLLLYYDLEDAARARRPLELAHALDPAGAGADYGLLSALESMYGDAADHGGLVRVYRAKLAQASSQDMREAYELLIANALAAQSRWDDCEATLVALLEAAPGNVAAARLLGRARLERGDPSAARDTWVPLLGRPELGGYERLELLREVADVELRIGDHAAAAARYEAVLHEVPGDAAALSRLKELHAGTGDWVAVAAVLGREFGLLRGDPTTGFGFERDTPPPIDAPFRDTAARVLVEAASALSRCGDRVACAKATRWAIGLAPDEPDVIEACAALADQLGDAPLLARALSALSGQLLPGAARDAVAARLAALAALQNGGGDAADALGGRAGPAAGGEASTGAAGSAAASTAAPSAASPRDAQRTSEADPFSAVDARAARGDLRGALAELNAWLARNPAPPVRRALLVRKGRWLLDDGDDGRAASLPLKGALILDPRAAETHLELLRAGARMGDTSMAADQLREAADALTDAQLDAPDTVARLASAVAELRRLPRAPVDAWLREQLAERSATLADAVWTLLDRTNRH